MKWAVLSIPHTGTHTVLDILGGTVPHLRDKMCIPYEQDGNDYLIQHIFRLSAFEIAETNDYQIVCPLRHPIKTVESWCNWQEKAPITIENVEGAELIPNPERLFQPEYALQMYKSLIWASELYDINFVPVDSPRREDYLRKLNERYSLSLTTNWKPLNSIGEYVTSTPEELRQATDAFIEANLSFFGKFYG